MIATCGTLIGTVAGYLGAGWNEARRDKRSAEREASARHAALVEKLEEERHAFQQDTLLELQDKLLELVRVVAMANKFDAQSVKEKGKVTELPDSVGGEGSRRIFGDVARLRSRVLDPELRQKIGEFTALCASDPVVQGEDFFAPHAAWIQRDIEVSREYELLAEHLGRVIRGELDRRPGLSESQTGVPAAER